MEEIWKDIKDYEGLYQVSNKGRVKSLARIDYHNHPVKERILKPGTKSNGYLQVVLCKDGKRKNFLVHHIVAEAFISNIENLPFINHIDENKKNNFAKNLEFCTAQYNTNYGTRNKRIGEKNKGKKRSEKAKKKISDANSKTILQLDRFTNKIIKEWQSAKEVFEKLGFDRGSISKCCNGKLKSCGGFKWQFKNG